MGIAACSSTAGPELSILIRQTHPWPAASEECAPRKLSAVVKPGSMMFADIKEVAEIVAASDPDTFLQLLCRDRKSVV